MILFIFLDSEIEKDEDADPDYCPAVIDSIQGKLLDYFYCINSIK